MADQMETLTEEYFNYVYQNSHDPWNFESSEYELNKYAVTISSLIKERYGRAFEIGCSIGVLTQMLAVRCNTLLSVDVAEAPLVKARSRLSEFPHVEIQKMTVPAQFPEQSFDLIVMSEVGYYFTMPDLLQLQQRILDHLEEGGQLLLVHWTPEVHDYPLTGDQVHEAFLSLSKDLQPLRLVQSLRAETYRLDSFVRR
ncbi:SAM-dependent methyltransferase [Dyadobacter sandarakinus]|uniref:Methyltransferase domain-containing protein n=1 Tax=Dyadobacter sandarakinus TaxID=2747268 RepID=A0ABX7I6I6_9BACT|nr:SAM-dependent methyltransferase [Dyadobacter sandarakinus]QRR01463.1 methyltransferase domain-containing protein [Dyadobacter sandarakinus]